MHNQAQPETIIQETIVLKTTVLKTTVQKTAVQKTTEQPRWIIRFNASSAHRASCRQTKGISMGEASNPHAQPSLFGDDDTSTLSESQQRLVHAYQVIDRPLDDLPYTQAFETEILGLDRGEGHLTAEQRDHAHASLHTLQNLRKKKLLPHVSGKSASLMPMTPEEAVLLETIVLTELATLGKRDGLPYTQAMDRIVERFNAETGMAYSHHSVWRKITRLAK